MSVASTKKFQSYVVPPVAASTAIVPAFYLFATKTAFQRSETRPLFNLKTTPYTAG